MEEKYTVLWQYMTLAKSLKRNTSQHSLKGHLLSSNFLDNYCFSQKYLRIISKG